MFIDASEMGHMITRVNRDFSDDDIATIRDTYYNWRGVIARTQDEAISSSQRYEDIKGFCKSATIEDIRKHSHVLTPGRYVGIEDEIDDGIPFETKMEDLTNLLKEQMEQEEALNEEIKTQLANIGFRL